MVLIKENITEAVTMLKNLLAKCIDEKIIIDIHGNIDGFVVRYSSVLDEFYVDHEELCLICGWFEVYNNNIITDIKFSVPEKSVHINFSNGELYIDLNKFDSNLD